MVEHDELIQDLHEDLKEWIIPGMNTLTNLFYGQKLVQWFSIKHFLIRVGNRHGVEVDGLNWGK